MLLASDYEILKPYLIEELFNWHLKENAPQEIIDLWEAHCESEERRHTEPLTRHRALYSPKWEEWRKTHDVEKEYPIYED